MLSKRDRYFLSVALSAAAESECRMQHGAVAVKNGNILSVGINRNVNSVLNLSEEHIKHYASHHAEDRALAKIANTDGVVLYVARVMKDGSTGPSKPCDRCEDFMKDAGVSKVVFSTPDGGKAVRL